MVTRLLRMSTGTGCSKQEANTVSYRGCYATLQISATQPVFAVRELLTLEECPPLSWGFLKQKSALLLQSQIKNAGVLLDLFDNNG